jgi:hypothetical protein
MLGPDQSKSTQTGKITNQIQTETGQKPESLGFLVGMATIHLVSYAVADE